MATYLLCNYTDQGIRGGSSKQCCARACGD